MSSHHHARAASFERSRTASRIQRAFIIASVFALAIILQGCAARPASPLAGADPADASSPTPAIRHGSTIGSFASLRPAAPATWSKQSAPTAETKQ